jgi:O-acetyl-ADP-ribose deacetylase (regulator of RNase III)
LCGRGLDVSPAGSARGDRAARRPPRASRRSVARASRGVVDGGPAPPSGVRSLHEGVGLDGRFAGDRKLNATIVHGDLLDQDVEVIVNAWNRNVIPWWLLLPQGVSGAIKKKGGLAPFKELGRHGPIPLGEAVLTGAGRLPYRGIIHVAGINMLWRASERSVRGSVRCAMRIVEENAFASVAFPVIGAGSGGFDQDRALDIMLDELSGVQVPTEVTIVRFGRP